MIESEQLLVATGRKPNTDTLNLNAAGVKVGKRKEILINDYARTSNEKIYAAGDVTLGPQFVYLAAYEGGIVADNAIGELNKTRFISGSRRDIYKSRGSNSRLNRRTRKRKRL